MDQPSPINEKKLKISYSRQKKEISKTFLYFYHKIEISKKNSYSPKTGILAQFNKKVQFFFTFFQNRI